jgi:RNA polymerase sigma-70 factor (ECF subfamily)
MKNQDLADDTTELVKAFRRGDIQAFNRLVFLYQTKIYNLCLNYVKAPEEAKDLAQDIFVTAYKALPKLREEAKFAAWLYQIAVNHCRNRYKRLSRRGFFSNRSLDDPDTYLQVTGDESPENKLEKNDVIHFVRETINTLNEAEREILILRDLQELSYEEISTILEIPLGTVKSKLNRARSSLKDKLKKIQQHL